jgi:hypothetical protein
LEEGNGNSEALVDLQMTKNLDGMLQMLCSKLGENFSATKITQKVGSEFRLSGLLVC